MELITKLVVLATAVIGLYKAATFGSSPSSPSSRSPALEAFRHFAGILLFMLAFPAFLWGFSWLATSMPHTSTPPRELVPKVPEFPKEWTNTDVLLAAAGGMPFPDSQSKTLRSVISFALSQRDYKTAVRAALMIPFPSDQDRELQNVVKAMTEQQTPKPLPSATPKTP